MTALLLILSLGALLIAAMLVTLAVLDDDNRRERAARREYVESDWDLRLAAFLGRHTMAVGVVLGIVGLVLYGLVGQRL